MEEEEKIKAADRRGLDENGRLKEDDPDKDRQTAKEAGRCAPPPLPEASFSTLVLGFATSALVELGEIPNPATGEKRANPEDARYIIDTLGIIGEKTKGNLNPEEDGQFKEILYNLRMIYVRNFKDAKKQ
jgi:hypothetical protein